MRVQIPASVALLAGTKSVGDKDAAHELTLYIENDSKMYKDIIKNAIENLAKKMAKGTFDKEKSEKLWKRVADEGAKKYLKEFGRREDYYSTFSAETRRMTAKSLAKGYLDEIKDRAKELKNEAKEKEKAKKAKKVVKANIEQDVCIHAAAKESWWPVDLKDLESSPLKVAKKIAKEVPFNVVKDGINLDYKRKMISLEFKIKLNKNESVDIKQIRKDLKALKEVRKIDISDKSITVEAKYM